MKGERCIKGRNICWFLPNPKHRGFNKEFGLKFLTSLQCGWTQISVFRVIKKLRLDSNFCFLNDDSFEQHGFCRHIHVSSSYYYVSSDYCVLLVVEGHIYVPCMCPPATTICVLNSY